MFKLIPEASTVLRYAWSVRLMLLAGMLTGLEASVPDIVSFLNLTNRQFSAINFAVVSAAFVARLVAQRKVSGDDE